MADGGDRFQELNAMMDLVWSDRDDLARRGIHLLSSQYDELGGKWIEFEVVTPDGEAAARHMREHYSGPIRLNIAGPSLTEEELTPWESYRVDAAGRSLRLRYATSGYHAGARAEVTETPQSVQVRLIERRRVGPYSAFLTYKEHEIALGSPLGARTVIDGAA